MMPRTLRLLAAAATILTCGRMPGAHAEPGLDALQVLADLTLIDGSCRDVIVNFGAGFRYAESRGVAETAILPGGARRPEFESVMRSRLAMFGAAELCGQIAKNYSEALPSSVMPIFHRAEARP